MTKIINLLNNANQNDPPQTYSVEFFPPKTTKGELNLTLRTSKFTNLSTQWIDLTWGAGGSTCVKTLRLSTLWSSKHPQCPINMHLTCTNMPASLIDQTLGSCIQSGINNIVALRGDSPEGVDQWHAEVDGFSCALDLVKYIRAKYGDHFCITVSGYPEGHPDKLKERGDTICGVDYLDEMDYLRQKVEAGADLIITQLFYDTKIFLRFVRDCRGIGIKCPIIPGIMLIQNYNGFHKMTKFCKTFVPQSIFDRLEEVKDDPEAVKALGVKIAVEMCQELAQGGIKHFHFYTLNKEGVAIEVINKLGLSKVVS